MFGVHACELPQPLACCPRRKRPSPCQTSTEFLYPSPSCHSAFEFILKILPNGMSTHHRLPCRSNDGPSRKQSTAAPSRLGSNKTVRRFLRNFPGSAEKRRAWIFFIS